MYFITKLSINSSSIVQKESIMYVLIQQTSQQ